MNTIGTNSKQVHGLTELLSRITETVRPAADEPFPEVCTAIGAVFSMNLRNYTTNNYNLVK